MRTVLLVAAILTWGLLSTGCGGGGSALAPHPAAGTSSATQQVRFLIDTPTSATAKARHIRYVAPTTTQIILDVQSGCPGSCAEVSGFPITASLTPTTNGCSSTLASTTCQLIVALAPGSYTATIVTKNASGAALSTAQAIPITVVAGQANDIHVSLSGIPVRISAVALTLDAFLIVAFDADGNFIVGPGAPTYTVAQQSGAPMTISGPTATLLNEFFVVPSAAGAATLAVNASFPAGSTDGCLRPTSVCSTAISMTATKATNLFVGLVAAGTVDAYASPYTAGPAGKIAFGLTQPTAVRFGPSGQLFVANSNANNSAILEYLAPYTGPAVQSFQGFTNPTDLAFDPSGTLYIDDFSGVGIKYLAAPYTGAPQPAPMPVGEQFGVLAIAIAPSGTLATVRFSTTVNFYDPPYNVSSTKHITGFTKATALRFDAAGNLYVNDKANLTISEYAPPYTGSPIATLPGSSQSFALDASGNLFVMQSGQLVEYAPPYTGSPVVTITAFGSAPYGIDFQDVYAVTVTP